MEATTIDTFASRAAKPTAQSFCLFVCLLLLLLFGFGGVVFSWLQCRPPKGDIIINLLIAVASTEEEEEEGEEEEQQEQEQEEDEEQGERA